jgi:hypothetical protein
MARIEFFIKYSFWKKPASRIDISGAVSLALSTTIEILAEL